MPRTLYICYFGVREPLVQTQVLPYLRELRKGNYSTPETRGHGDAAEKESSLKITQKHTNESDLPPRPAATPPIQGGELRVSLLTFEPGTDARTRVRASAMQASALGGEFEEIRRELAAEGIEWHWLPYHKRPSAIATAWDIARGALFIRRRIGQYDILHARVHVPMLMGALARKFSPRRPKLLFDIRGFMPEEYTDAGIWPEGGLLSRAAKRIERWLMREADGFVVLTERAREILFGKDEGGRMKDEGQSRNPKSEIRNPKSKMPSTYAGGSDMRPDPKSKKPPAYASGTDMRPVEVIPCCVDFERFAAAGPDARAEVRGELGIGDRRVLAYVGAFGGWYLTEETADFFDAARERFPNLFAMILTQSKPEMIEPLLLQRGFADGEYLIKRVASHDIPRFLSAADIAVSFIKPCYSKQASSPTKNAEYLACGLPIIANSGVGDVDKLIGQNRVGALVGEFTREAYLAALDEVETLGDISERCRDTARREFDLETVGGERYRRIYQNILK